MSSPVEVSLRTSGREAGDIYDWEQLAESTGMLHEVVMVAVILALTSQSVLGLVAKK